MVALSFEVKVPRSFAEYSLWSCPLTASLRLTRAAGRCQVLDFAKEVVGDKVFLVCNSVGGLAGLQAGLDKPDQVGW